MTRKDFSLIPAALLIEAESDSFSALVRQHKALAGEPHAPKSKAQSSKKSQALSQLVKAFKPAGGKKKSDLPGLPPEKPKSDSGLKKAAAALSKPGVSKVSQQGGHGSAGPDDVSKPARPSAIGKAAKVSSLPAYKDPHTDVDHPPGKWDAFEHDTPSLQSQARPDMIPHDERHSDFSDRYSAKGGKLSSMKYLGSHGQKSSSHVFQGKMDDDTHFIAKPHEHPWGERGAQPEEWERRHNGVARLMSHMGAGHMISPAHTATIHGKDAIPGDHPSVDAAGNKSAHHHSGNKAFVTEFAPNTVNMHEGHAVAHKVDGDHRLMGFITHLLTVNSDGHQGNVLIDKDKGHPTLIDHDLSMSLGVRRGEIRSQFMPGGPYDYQEKMGKIGKKYPPRVQKTLEWLVGGGHHHKEAGLDLHADDKKVLSDQAKLMLDHGLEGSIKEMRKRGLHLRH